MADDEDKKNKSSPTLPFVQGSKTSKAAAEDMADFAPGLAQRVLRFIRSRGAEGATDDEIEVGMELSHQNASARRNDLVKRGLVKDSGTERRTRSGHRAIVWVEGAGEALVGTSNARVRRPSNAEIRETVSFLRTQGVATLPPFPKVIDWLAHLARAEDAAPPAPAE